jgi:hypothetical protein
VVFSGRFLPRWFLPFDGFCQVCILLFNELVKDMKRQDGEGRMEKAGYIFKVIE